MQLDLDKLLPKTEIFGIDLASQLEHGLILREKEFRSWVSTMDWSSYIGKVVYIYCSSEAIIPTWAYLLVSIELTKVGVFHLFGSARDLQRDLVLHTLNSMNFEVYQDAKIVIKGCTDFVETPFAMTELVKRLQPFARSIMYGEPCSAVPVFKRK